MSHMLISCSGLF